MLAARNKGVEGSYTWTFNESIQFEVKSVHLVKKISWIYSLYDFYSVLFLPESQTEISEVEQDLKRAQDQKIEVERKLRFTDEEKQALEKVSLHT